MNNQFLKGKSTGLFIGKYLQKYGQKRKEIRENRFKIT